MDGASGISPLWRRMKACLPRMDSPRHGLSIPHGGVWHCRAGVVVVTDQISVINGRRFWFFTIPDATVSGGRPQSKIPAVEV